jgi:hypothetical protein
LETDFKPVGMHPSGLIPLAPCRAGAWGVPRRRDGEEETSFMAKRRFGNLRAN